MHTPGGVRCAECAQLRRPPMYEVGAGDYLKAALAATIVALPLGVAGSFLLPVQRASGFFSLTIGLLIGVGAGAVVSQAIARASGGKRGTTLQLLAVASVLIAAVVRLALLGELVLFSRDVAGVLAVVAGITYAWNQLR